MKCSIYARPVRVDGLYPRLASIILFIVCIATSSVLSWDEEKSAAFTSSPHSYLLAPMHVDVREPMMSTNNSLIQYALLKINNDRTKFGLPALALSQNKAAQAHAEELLKTKPLVPSHWTEDGMKPYMKYSKYGGAGYVEQNIAVRGYDNLTIRKCVAQIISCDKLNPYKEIDNAEWRMIHNDSICCKDGHRDDILDSHHTSVSLGIAYSHYYFAFVQNFENNYIQLTTQLTEDNKHIQILGMRLKNDGTLDSIRVYYDESPSHMAYEENKDRNSYELGAFISAIVPQPPLFLRYVQPSNYTLIQAEKWLQNDQSVDIRFDLSTVLKKQGVYTIVMYFSDNRSQSFPGALSSIFVK